MHECRRAHVHLQTCIQPARRSSLSLRALRNFGSIAHRATAAPSARDRVLQWKAPELAISTHPPLLLMLMRSHCESTQALDGARGRAAAATRLPAPPQNVACAAHSVKQELEQRPNYDSSRTYGAAIYSAEWLISRVFAASHPNNAHCCPEKRCRTSENTFGWSWKPVMPHT